MKEILENLNSLFTDFQTDSTAQVEKGNKSAGTRARRTSLEIEKKMKEFRKQSLAFGK